jgi:hypothetical protein
MLDQKAIQKCKLHLYSYKDLPKSKVLGGYETAFTRIFNRPTFHRFDLRQLVQLKKFDNGKHCLWTVMPHHLASRVLYSIQYTPTEIIIDISGLNIWRWILITYQTQTEDCAHLWIYSLKVRVLWRPATVSRHFNMVPISRGLCLQSHMNVTKRLLDHAFGSGS